MDLISRQAAIDAIEQHKTAVLEGREWDEGIAYGYAAAHRHLVEIVKQLPSAERRGRWMPVTEQLPEEEGLYLVSCDTDYGVEVGRFYIDEDGERYFGCDWNDPDDIKAWMPLPKPYKDDNTD